MIYYLGWYKSPNLDDFNLSANNAGSFKMGYVIRKIKETGNKITVVSCCTSDKNGYVPLREVKVDDSHVEHFLPSLRLKGVLRKFAVIFRRRAMAKYLKRLTEKDTLIVYHALGIDKILEKAKKRRKFRLVLEVEEIYHADSTLTDYEKKKKQEQNLINLSDSYIVVNDLIYDKYIASGKPYTVLYGVYDGANNADKVELDKNLKHVLFSGSIDRVRGAFLAVETAKSLSKDFVLHISGGGNANLVRELKEKIEIHNKKEGCAKIEFHGQLLEKDLEMLANSCDIGLNLQDVNNPFEAVSFPSKITFYMLHGLNVVSTKMSSVKASKLSDYVNFCDYDPKATANAIMSIPLKDRRNQINVMKDLDNDAKNQISKIL